MLKLALFIFSINIMFAGIMNPVKDFLAQRSKEFDSISDNRKAQLQEISKFVANKIKSGEEANLTFICTHNSRRSHLAQLLTQAGSDFYGLSGINTFSGGTESTAFNPRAVKALQRAGFLVEMHKNGEDENNPLYHVKWRPAMDPEICFSKKFDSNENPSEDFAAVMVCSSADKECPYVAGASERFAIPYIDPKEADNTPEEAKAYDDKTKEIATEMLYMLSLANQMINQ